MSLSMGKSPVLGAHAWKRVEGPWRECHLDWAALKGPDRGASALVTRATCLHIQLGVLALRHDLAGGRFAAERPTAREDTRSGPRRAASA